MFPKIEVWEDFTLRVSLICELILNAVKAEQNIPKSSNNKELDKKVKIVSVDEKTSIQAIERLEAPGKQGTAPRLESEYTRHGTTCLMAANDVATDSIIHHQTQPTRTEKDFLNFIDKTTEKLGEKDDIVFLLDQLNTHKSESLVIWVSQKIGYKGQLGKKGVKGILKSMKTRMQFLENPKHSIRFVFTPKHCSWLNPIENWFSKLQRQVIKYGNFLSVNELENKIDNYVEFYNKSLRKILKWKFKGFQKAQELYCLKFSS